MELAEARPEQEIGLIENSEEWLRSSEPLAEIPILDLFSGAGGLSHGLSQAGMKPVAAIENMPEAAQTYEALHGVAVESRRIEDVSDETLSSFRNQVRIVVGGPPCQPWSIGGLRRGQSDDRDGFSSMVRALELIRPEAFLIENVAGLEQGRTREYFLALIDELRTKVGYSITYKVLDAADFGVPQHRRRLFIVGLRSGEFGFPEPTHGPDTSRPWLASGSVVGFEPLGDPNNSIVTFAKNPDLRPSPFDGLLFNGGGRPLDLSAPARTILASAGGNKTPFVDTAGIVPEYHASLWKHLKEHGQAGLSRLVRKGLVPGARRITIPESAALQSFPAETRFFGSPSTQYTLIGNAVPPKLATAIGSALRDSLDP